MLWNTLVEGINLFIFLFFYVRVLYFSLGVTVLIVASYRETHRKAQLARDLDGYCALFLEWVFFFFCLFSFSCYPCLMKSFQQFFSLHSITPRVSSKNKINEMFFFYLFAGGLAGYFILRGLRAREFRNSKWWLHRPIVSLKK